MNDPFSISIIIPVYNCKEYIRECLESVCRQKLKKVEIICVDACSFDGTQDILDEYRKKDKRIKTILSDKKSMGYQYNLGIKASCGEYIGFVEADDFIDEGMFEALFLAAQESQAEIVKSDWWLYKDGISRIESMLTDRESYYCLLNGIPTEAVVKEGTFGHWSGIYKRSYLLDNKILFNETMGASYQDLGFFFLAYAFRGTTYLIDKPYYHYRQDNPKASVKDFRKYYYVTEEFLYTKNKLIENHLFEKHGETFARFFFQQYMWGLRRTNGEEQLKFAYKFVEDYQPLIKGGFCTSSLFQEEQLRMLNDLIKDPLKLLELHRKQRTEYINKLSQIKNLILVGKGMVANWILRELPKSNNLLANITSEEIDSMNQYKNNGYFLIAAKKESYRTEIIKKMVEAGIKTYTLVPCELFDY